MGALLDLTVPVRDRHGVEGFLTCEQVFVYSAEISNGCIVRYPFLKCYGLQLDAPQDCLVDTLAEYSEPTVLREVGTDSNLPSLLIQEAPGEETPSVQWTTWAAAITQTLASLGQQVAAVAVAVQRVTTVATVMSATRNASLGGEQPLPSPPKQQFVTPPRQPVTVCQCVWVGLVAPDRQFDCDDSYCLVQEYEDSMGDPQYADSPPTGPPYSMEWMTIAQARYKPPQSIRPPTATREAGDGVPRFIPPPPEVEPQRFRCQCLRQCGCHLAVDPNGGTESEQGLSEAESEEGEPILARPLTTPSPVHTVFPDSFAGGWGYHQNHNGQWRGEALPEPPTRQPRLSGTDPPTDKQVVQRYGRFPGSSSGTTSVRPVRISKKAQALPTAARRKALHKSASRTYKTEAYAVLPSLKQEILAWAGVSGREQQSMVDAFAQKCNAQFPRYWTQAQDAFSKDWGRDHLWVNAPFSRMQDVVLKAIMDQAQGIMIVPVWKAHDWFWELGEIALDWWDLPADQPVYQDNAGFVLPPSRGWTTRVVLFDALSSNVRDSACDAVAGGYEGDTDTSPRLRDLVEHDAKGKYYRPRSQRSVRAAMQADQEDPRCAEMRAQLQESFKEKIFQHTPIKGVPRDLRPHGEHAIPFKTAPPQPQKCVPYRTCGIRDAAFRELVNKFIARGFLQKSGSVWGARAFVVPKPGGKWRLVIDYRHLNSQVSDDPFPLPVREDPYVLIWIRYFTQWFYPV